MRTAAPTTAPATTSATWTAEQVVGAFKAAGLEAENPTKMTREDYGGAPTVGEGTRFLIPSLGADKGGRIFTGPPADLERLRSYYVETGRGSPAFFSHTFMRDNVLVQIDGQLPGDKARQYDAALQAMK